MRARGVAGRAVWHPMICMARSPSQPVRQPTLQAKAATARAHVSGEEDNRSEMMDYESEDADADEPDAIVFGSRPASVVGVGPAHTSIDNHVVL